MTTATAPRRRPTGEPASDAVIAVEGLEMHYGGTPVVCGVDLCVRRGETFALLGPNGAGKTTTVEILEGYRRRTGGSVSVLGEDPVSAGADWRARVGVVLQSCVPEAELTVAETLDLYAGFHRHPLPVDDVIGMVGLSDAAGVRNQHLSGGQQRRLDVALALIGDPELLFLDEPTTGFDPAARRAAWDVIAGLSRLGKTVVLTTHYLEEAEVLADRIAVMSSGRIVASGTPATLAGRHLAATEVRVETTAALRRRQLPADLADQILIDGRVLRMDTTRPVEDLHRLCGWLLENGIGTGRVSATQPTLEDTYLSLITGDVA